MGIQAVFKASWPMDRLRTFLCVTMTAGFYAAVLVLRARLQVALPSAETLWLLLGFAVVSFLVDRVATLALRLADRARLRGKDAAGRILSEPPQVLSALKNSHRMNSTPLVRQYRY